jgi:hypothetical protein
LRPLAAQGEREPTGNRPFDRGCKSIGAERRRHGRALDGRVADILKSTRFRAAALDRYLGLCSGYMLTYSTLSA